MSKFGIHQVVKYDKRPGLFVVIGLEEGITGIEYQIMVRNAFDNWEPEKPETYPKDDTIINGVLESELVGLGK